MEINPNSIEYIKVKKKTMPKKKKLTMYEAFDLMHKQDGTSKRYPLE